MLTEEEKTKRLERAIISEAPEEIKRIYKELSGVSFTAHALGIASLYRGLDTVKALVECGADFRYPKEGESVYDDVRLSHYYGQRLPSFYRRVGANYKPDFSMMVIGISKLNDDVFKPIENKEVLPVSERAAVVDYICDNAERTGTDLQKLLHFSIREGHEEFYKVLKNHGVSISEDSALLFIDSSSNYACDMDSRKFLKVFGLIAKELNGRKIWGSQDFYNSYFENVLSAESFELILDLFYINNMNQMLLLKKIIDGNHASCFPVAEKKDWLNPSDRCDELIQYSLDKGRPECTMWLLSYKNRTFNLGANPEETEEET